MNNNSKTNDIVSIIITTKNSSKTIGKCIESINWQTYEKIETLVIDGISNDDTCEIAKNLGAKAIELPGERTKAKNYGITQSTGDFVFFVDSDMVLDKNVVEECVNTFQENDKAGGIIIPEHSIGSSFWVRVRDFERQMYEGTKIESARFFKKDLVSQVGGFDEDIIIFEESTVPQKIEDKGYDVDVRIKSFIFHNEEGFKLSRWLSKKNYYYKTAKKYSQKYSKVAKPQLSVTYRIKVFTKKGNWKKLIRHPVMTVGLFTLKSMEFFASKF